MSYKNQHIFYSSRLMDCSAHIGQLQHNSLLRNFTLGKRNRIMFYNPLDIHTSLLKANNALTYILNQRGTVWWISTQPEQARLIQLAAESTRQNYVTRLWKSGLLTNKTQQIQKHHTLLNRPTKLPDLLIIIDATAHSQVIREANLLNIPVMSIADTNTPLTLLSQITYLITGNPRSISFVYHVIMELLNK